MRVFRASFTAAVLAAVLRPGPVHAQALPPATPLEEHLRTEIPVGGADLVGVVTASDASPVDPSLLVAFLPETEAAAMCVTVRSRDGRYWGRAEFSLAAVQSGAVALAWQTEHTPFLSRLPRSDLAVLAELAPCPGGGPAVPGVWGSGDATSTLTFLVNVGTVDEIVLSTRDGSIRGACSHFTEGRSVAYDTRCTMTLPPGLHALRLVTWHFESRSTRSFAVAIR